MLSQVLPFLLGERNILHYRIFFGRGECKALSALQHCPDTLYTGAICMVGAFPPVSCHLDEYWLSSACIFLSLLFPFHFLVM